MWLLLATNRIRRGSNRLCLDPLGKEAVLKAIRQIGIGSQRSSDDIELSKALRRTRRTMRRRRKKIVKRRTKTKVMKRRKARRTTTKRTRNIRSAATLRTFSLPNLVVLQAMMIRRTISLPDSRSKRGKGGEKEAVVSSPRRKEAQPRRRRLTAKATATATTPKPRKPQRSPLPKAKASRAKPTTTKMKKKKNNKAKNNSEKQRKM
mmetsp:Transcript_79710/g.165601  ORF Transcript_79710/g.165601 Transcript_79710/m.165601 type:complete len:206 (+) Transcript_79710:1355-1972(+)